MKKIEHRIEQDIAQALERLQATRGEYAEQLDQAKARVAELKASITRIDSVIRAGRAPEERVARKQRRTRKVSDGKRYPVDGLSDEKVDLLLQALGSFDEPVSTTVVAEASGLSTTSTSRALKQLAEAGFLRGAGMQPGVKGRRPLWAAWPENGKPRQATVPTKEVSDGKR